MGNKLKALLMLFIIPYSVNAEFSLTFEQEAAIYDNGKQHKFESIIAPEWFFSISKNIDMTFIVRARFDSGTNLGFNSPKGDNFSSINGAVRTSSDGDIAIREWYIETESEHVFWKIGKQQVVWGQADGLKVLDVINPQSFREFVLDEFADSRIPLWMINAEIPLNDDNTLQLLWIPDSTYHELAHADAPFAFTSPLFVPQLVEGVEFLDINQAKPSRFFKDSDVGLQFSSFTAGWDLTLNYLYHYLDTPVLFQSLSDEGIRINSTYKRKHLFGASASNSFGDYTFRSELGYSTDSYHLSSDTNQTGIANSADMSWVIGLDWMGLTDTMISAQWFQSHLFDYEDSIIREQNNTTFSFLYTRSFKNDSWNLNILELHNIDYGDGSVQIQLDYELNSQVKLWVGADIFYGDKQGLFGQFNNQDRLTVGFQWGL